MSANYTLPPDTLRDRDTEPAPPPEPTDGKVRGLLVEDDPVEAELFRVSIPVSVLQKLELKHVSSLREAFEHFEAGHRVDVVLLDLGLPGSNGRETLLRFQARAPSYVPVVVLTGRDDGALASQMMEEDGAFSYLLKGRLAATEIANIVIELGSRTRQLGYRLDVDERELFRRSTQASTRLREALASDESTSEILRCIAQLQLALSAESGLILAKINAQDAES